jgi:serine phosphatase RsbU (regulator of sigma subunit)
MMVDPFQEGATSWRHLVDGSTTAFAATWGSNHQLFYTNPTFQRLCQQPPEALLDRPLDAVLPPVQLENIRALLERVHASGTAETTLDVEYRSVGGNPSYWSFTAQPIGDAQRGVEGLLVQLTDISDQALLRQHHEQHARQLRSISQALLLSSLRALEAVDAAELAAQQIRQLLAEQQAAYEREHRIAAILQRPLLLKVAEDAVAGLSLATFYEPARADAEVGGDFFDVVPLVGDGVALVVGDTCGKGLEAAVHNTHVKDVLRAFLRESPWRPGAILARLNNVVCDALETQDPDQDVRFVVLALLILETGTGRALYSSAGAEPLLVVRSDGTVEILERPGLPLGIERGVLYDETPVRLASGDTALLVTDGVTEARHGRELLGYPGMVQLATQALQASTLEESGQEILAGARAFAGGGLAGGGLSDDACLLLARRR